MEGGGSKTETEHRPSGPQVGGYIFGKTLGQGATGKVKLAKHIATGQLVAIKIVRKDYLDRKPNIKQKLQKEITVMKLCDHPNVLKLYDVFELDTHLCVMRISILRGREWRRGVWRPCTVYPELTRLTVFPRFLKSGRLILFLCFPLCMSRHLASALLDPFLVLLDFNSSVIY